MASSFPVYDFSDPALDYSLVEATVKRMVTYLDSSQRSVCCCSNKQLKAVMGTVTPKLYAMQLNKEASDTDRYNDDVMICYLLLYPLT